MHVYDNEGNMLGALPADAVPFGSRGQQTQLLMLMGKFVDPDDIVYDADGTVNEAATAAWSREIAAGRTAAPYVDYAEQAEAQRKESVQQVSVQEGNRMYWDSMFDNVYTTAAEIPGRVADAAKEGVKDAFDIGKWLVIGLVAYAVIKVADRIPSRGHVKRYAQKKIRVIRRQVARHIGG